MLMLIVRSLSDETLKYRQFYFREPQNQIILN